MPILDNLGGIFLSPSRYLREFSLNPEYSQQLYQRKEIIYHRIFINATGILLGLTLTFFFMYPELYWYPNTIKVGPTLLILYAVSPIYLILIFLIGYLLVILDTNLFTRLICKLMHRFKKRAINNTNLKSDSNLRELIAIFSYGWIPIIGFCVYTTLHMYWFEKINYAKIFFPFIDFSGWNVVHLIVLTICIGRKFQIEYLVTRYLMHCSKKQALIPVMTKLFVFILIIVIIPLIINPIILQFA